VLPTLDPDLSGPVEVLEGEFTYGATPLQSEQALTLCEELGGTCRADFFSDAEPAVRIVLNTFYIDRTEVTNGAYKACVEAGSCAQPEGMNAEGLGISDYYLNEANRNYPVVGVTWNQADAYCRWAGGRLPSEAEWEKVASWDSTNLDKRVWPWGQNWDATLVNAQDDTTPVGEPEPVGSRPGNASPYGALDMAGNVAEWVADWYVDDYYETLATGQVNPPGPAEEEAQGFKVMRGGSWDTNGVFTRTIHRLLALQDHANNSIGFRCAYDVSPEPTPNPGAGASDAPPLITGDQTAEQTATAPAP
jgi:formylglycine-generating enzyme required for sulfatase activity